MKVGMQFNGDMLVLNLSVEDECERALAELLEAYCVASVSLDMEQRNQYDAWDRDRKVVGLNVYLRKPKEDVPND